MTIEQLHRALTAMMKADEYTKDMQIRFGPEMHHVQGGIVARDTTGLAVLSLAPIKLDQVGGF